MQKTDLDIALDFDLDMTSFDLDLDADLDLALGQEFDDEACAGVETALHVSRYPRPKPYMVKYERAEELAAHMPDMLDGVRVSALVSGNFIFGDFVEAWMVHTNCFAEELMVATLSLGKENVDSLHNLLTGGFVGKMSLIVSDFWYAHERRKLGGVPYIMDTLGVDERFSFAAAGLHTKVTLIRTACGKHIVMHGSANMRSSRNLEQFSIDNDADLYAFHRQWMAEIGKQFAVTKKSKRGDELWQRLLEPTRNQDSPVGETEKQPPAKEIRKENRA